MLNRQTIDALYPLDAEALAHFEIYAERKRARAS